MMLGLIVSEFGSTGNQLGATYFSVLEDPPFVDQPVVARDLDRFTSWQVSLSVNHPKLGLRLATKGDSKEMICPGA